MKNKLIIFFSLLGAVVLASCGVYSFTDASVPANIKTVRIQYIENRARYINPQLSPQLTDRLRTKITNQTRLTPVQSEPDYDISGYVSDYSVTTSDISNQQAATNRLTVSIHIVFQNRVDPTKNSRRITLPPIRPKASCNAFSYSI